MRVRAGVLRARENRKWVVISGWVTRKAVETAMADAVFFTSLKRGVNVRGVRCG
jgi:hypothetical protein